MPRYISTIIFANSKKKRTPQRGGEKDIVDYSCVNEEHINKL